LNILLVDDDEVDRLAVRRALRKVSETTRIDEFVDKASGIEALLQSDYDCVIVDYILPDGDGLTFVREALARNENVPPIVILTGQGDRDADLQAMKAGAAEYLEKDGLRADVLDRAIRYAIQNRQLVNKLKETNEKLKELDQLKSEFLSTASHELRTPLTIIREFIALVHDGVTGPLTEEQQDCLASALSNCDRLGSIINDLLDLQRIESGRLILERRKVDLQALSARCINDFKPACEKKQQRLSLDNDAGVRYALCDEEKILQVLVNPIGNAHKFTPEEGSLSVRIAGGVDGMAQIVVEDDGPGIDPEDQERIFDKFTQINRNAGPGKKGTGLGLAITRRIVELHDGVITVESAEGEGCRFIFTLPLYNDYAALKCFINDRACNEAASGKEWTLLLLSGDPAGENPLANEAARCRIEALARRSMRCEEDSLLFLEEARTLVFMLQCMVDGAVKLEARMLQALEAEHKGGGGLEFDTVPVYFEDLDRFVEELIQGFAPRERVSATKP